MFQFPDWSDEIADAAEEYMNASIEVVKGQTATNVRLYLGKARVQHVRFPREGENVADWIGARSYRFQIPLTDDLPFINSGALIKVRSGSRDPELYDMLFEVVASTNSSHAAVRTLETKVVNKAVGSGGGS